MENFDRATPPSTLLLWWYRRNNCCKFLPIDGVRILFLHLNCAPRILIIFEQRASNCNISIWTARLKLELHLNQAPWERHLWQSHPDPRWLCLWAKVIQLPALFCAYFIARINTKALVSSNFFLWLLYLGPLVCPRTIICQYHLYHIDKIENTILQLWWKLKNIEIWILA